MTKEQAGLFLEAEGCCCMVRSSAAYSFVMGKVSVISEELPSTIPLWIQTTRNKQEGADAVSTFLFYVHALEGEIRYGCSINFRHNRSDTII